MSEARKRPGSDALDEDPAEEPAPSAADLTLGGYLEEHNRPPAFEGLDGEPYTVSPEVEQTPNLLAPYEGYLVFPRWAATGVGVIGHLETSTLHRGVSREAVAGELGRLPLWRVKELLDEAVRAAHSAPEDESP